MTPVEEMKEALGKLAKNKSQSLDAAGLLCVLEDDVNAVDAAGRHLLSHAEALEARVKELETAQGSAEHHAADAGRFGRW